MTNSETKEVYEKWLKVVTNNFLGDLGDEPACVIEDLMIDSSFSIEELEELSKILDFPHPLGPTMIDTPGRNSTAVFAAKDLKPVNSTRFRNI